MDLLVEGFLIVELDGFAFHADRTAFREDRRRNNTAALHGLPTLRYLYEDVVFGQERILAEVIEVLRTWPGAGGLRPPGCSEKPPELPRRGPRGNPRRSPGRRNPGGGGYRRRAAGASSTACSSSALRARSATGTRCRSWRYRLSSA